MNTIARAACLLAFAVPAWAGAQTGRDVAHISGSIYPTVIRPAPLPPRPSPAPASQALVAGNVHAVCLASRDESRHCEAGTAFCDVSDVGLAHCLARYASALVKRPSAASRALSFVVRDAGGMSSTVTVLATASESDDEIAAAAIEGKPGASIVAMRMPANAARLP